MNIKQIESPHNAALKPLLNPKHAGGGRFKIEGTNLFEAALDSGRVELGPVFVTRRALGQHEELITRAAKRAEGIYEVPDHIMKRISDTETPQGLVALCSMRPWELKDLGLNRVVVILDAISDPGNVGTIIRTAEAVGAGGVIILPGTADPFSPKALRASAGSSLRVPLVRAELPELKGLRIVIAAPRDGKAFYEADLSAPVAIAFGSEAHGISDSLKRIAKESVTLPLMGRAESLNVASAAAVILYETLRRSH